MEFKKSTNKNYDRDGLGEGKLVEQMWSLTKYDPPNVNVIGLILNYNSI